MLLWLITLAALLAFRVTATSAQLAIIVHPSNTAPIGYDEVLHLYLNKARDFASSADTSTMTTAALVLHVNRSDPLHAQFCMQLMNMSPSQYKSYWSRLLFAGSATAPLYLDSQQQLLERVMQQPNAIGYVAADADLSKVRVLGYLSQGQWQPVSK